MIPSYFKIEILAIQDEFVLLGRKGLTASGRLYSTSEDRDVHGHRCSVGLVEPDTEIPLPTEQQEDEHTDVEQTNTS